MSWHEVSHFQDYHQMLINQYTFDWYFQYINNFRACGISNEMSISIHSGYLSFKWMPGLFFHKTHSNNSKVQIIHQFNAPSMQQINVSLQTLSELWSHAYTERRCQKKVVPTSTDPSLREAVNHMKSSRTSRGLVPQKHHASNSDARFWQWCQQWCQNQES